MAKDMAGYELPSGAARLMRPALVRLFKALRDGAVHPPETLVAAVTLGDTRALAKPRLLLKVQVSNLRKALKQFGLDLTVAREAGGYRLGPEAAFAFVTSHRTGVRAFEVERRAA